MNFGDNYLIFGLIVWIIMWSALYRFHVKCQLCEFKVVWTRARRYIKMHIYTVPHRMIQIVFVEMPTVADVYKNKNKFMNRRNRHFRQCCDRSIERWFICKKQIQCELIGETRYITLALIVRAQIIYKFHKFDRIFFCKKKTKAVVVVSFVKSNCFFYWNGATVVEWQETKIFWKENYLKRLFGPKKICKFK